MRLLLDTHIYLWWVADAPQLSKQARKFIVDAREIYLSSASILEISIKAKLGKLETDLELILTDFNNCDFKELPISFRHAAYVSKIPLLHSDPFDRLLVAQAITESMRLLTADAKLKEYSELVELV